MSHAEPHASSSLTGENLQVWYAPEVMKPGIKLHEEIEHAVRMYDKFLLVLSNHSMSSEWVATEIRIAIDKEKKIGFRKLVPIHLVRFEQIKKLKCFNADTGKDMGVELRECYIPDFSQWRHQNKYLAALKKLLEALRA
jgi:hypothetical protein